MRSYASSDSRPSHWSGSLLPDRVAGSASYSSARVLNNSVRVEFLSFGDTKVPREYGPGAPNPKVVHKGDSSITIDP